MLLHRGHDILRSTLGRPDLCNSSSPETNWARYRGAGGMDYPHPITVGEQGKLLRKKPNAITSKPSWPARKRLPGGSFQGYQRGDFDAAWWEPRPHRSVVARGCAWSPSSE